MDESLLRKFHKELSAGTVSLALLAVVAAGSEAMYGYQIAKRLEQVGDGVLAGKQSALYPVLRNLEGAGLLESFVEPSMSGPPRRYYRATVAGRDALTDWSAAWRATRDSLDRAARAVVPELVFLTADRGEHEPHEVHAEGRQQQPGEPAEIGAPPAPPQRENHDDESGRDRRGRIRGRASPDDVDPEVSRGAHDESAGADDTKAGEVHHVTRKPRIAQSRCVVQPYEGAGEHKILRDEGEKPDREQTVGGIAAEPDQDEQRQQPGGKDRPAGRDQGEERRAGKDRRGFEGPDLRRSVAQIDQSSNEDELEAFERRDVLIECIPSAAEGYEFEPGPFEQGERGQPADDSKARDLRRADGQPVEAQARSILKRHAALLHIAVDGFERYKIILQKSDGCQPCGLRAFVRSAVLPDAPMLERTILFAGAAFLAALILEVSIRRQVLPFVIFWRGWTLSILQIFRDPGNLLQVFALIAIGSLAQEYLAVQAPPGATGLVVAAVAWQAAMALALALCAARFHLAIVPGVFADAEYERMRLPQWRRIAAPVALVGGTVWLLGYGVTVLSNLLVLNSPAGLISVSAIGMALFAQVLLTPLALIRPAIACGAKQPIANGLRLAMRKMPLLLFLVVVLALPPLLLQFGLGLLQAFAGLGEAGHAFASAVIAVFGVLQFFAYEAVTLIVLRDAVRPIVDPHAISGLRP